VARTPSGIDVGDWIAEEVSSISVESEPVALVERLIRADDWLKNVHGDRRIAFSVVGFAGRRPFATIVSNFLDLSGRYEDHPTPKLEVFSERPKKPAVRLAGAQASVLQDEKVRLVSSLNGRKPPREILAQLASVNEAASTRTRAVSRECIVGFLLASGAAEITPYGIADGIEYVPRFVRRYFQQVGVNALRPKVGSDGLPLPPRWRGMTAKIENRPGRPWAIAVMHAIGNVMDPVSSGVAGTGAT